MVSLQFLIFTYVCLHMYVYFYPLYLGNLFESFFMIFLANLLRNVTFSRFKLRLNLKQFPTKSSTKCSHFHIKKKIKPENQLPLYKSDCFGP